MKNLMLALLVVFCLTTFMGCNKKKNEPTDLNAVMTENVVSVENASVNGMNTNTIPVVEENAVSAKTLESVDENVVPGQPIPKLIQQALKNAGLYKGKIDGNIGPMTKKAIETFQSQNGLKADGKVGRKTWKVLSPYLNKSAEVVNPSSDAQTVSQ